MSAELSSEFINEEGFTRCTSCRRKISVSDAEMCMGCMRFVCPSCRKYRKQGNPYGYVCKKCQKELSN